jgi:hypothetical protein
MTIEVRKHRQGWALWSSLNGISVATILAVTRSRKTALGEANALAGSFGRVVIIRGRPNAAEAHLHHLL